MVKTSLFTKMSTVSSLESDNDFLKAQNKILKRKIKYLESKLSGHEPFPKDLYYEAQEMCVSNNISELSNFFQRNPDFDVNTINTTFNENLFMVACGNNSIECMKFLISLGVH